MTDKELEKIGIIADKTTLRKNRYWCNTTETHISVTKYTTQVDIMAQIFQSGYMKGIQTGKAQRSQELKNLINNEDLD